MRAPRSLLAAFLLAFALALLSACAGTPAPPVATVEVSPLAPTSPSSSSTHPADTTSGPIPLSHDDATAGSPSAPVTLVVFADVTDPFSRGAVDYARGLVRRFGDADLRLAVKLLPSPFRPGGRSAALFAAAVLEVGGPHAFFRYLDALSAAPAGAPPDAGSLVAGLRSELAPEALARARTGPGPARRVDDDTALAASLQVSSGPWIFVNGAPCGTRNRCTWVDTGESSPLLRLVERELGQARAALAAGTPAQDLYAARCTENLAVAAAAEARGKQGGASSPAAADDDRMGARHLVVMYQGSTRAPSTVTRTRDEARARAGEALRRLRAGASFADLVAEYSDEPGAAARGGDLGLFRTGQMVKPFEDAVRKLKTGQNDLVETQFGFHVVQRTH